MGTTIPSNYQKEFDEATLTGHICVYAFVDGQCVGTFQMIDDVKSTTISAVSQLQSLGIRVIMCTGDAENTAKFIAQKCGIDEYHAQSTPEEKSKLVQSFLDRGEIVAMVGDGINDSPALALANVGIAMGTGSDIAIESADLTLIKGDLMGLVSARRLSSLSMRNIRQNVFFAFIYNTLGIPIASGVLYPFFGLLLSPVIAAAAMSFSSVPVILNSLRLKAQKL